LLLGAYRRALPVTVHVALGTDTPHMHPTADAAAIGRGTHHDFRLFCSLVAELNGSARTNFTRDVLTLNFGIRHQLSEHSIWIASLGHEVRTPAGESRALVGYCGVQLVY
jgi:hypothetical protein